jgi:hypothetical protein
MKKIKTFYALENYYWSCAGLCIINHILIRKITGFEIKKINEDTYCLEYPRSGTSDYIGRAEYYYITENKEDAIKFAEQYLSEHYNEKIKKIKEMLNRLPIVFEEK